MVNHSIIKANTIPLVTALLIVVLFFAIEPQDIFRPINQQLSVYSDSEAGAESIVTNTEKGSTARRGGLMGLALFGVICLWRPGNNEIKVQGLLGVLVISFLCWATLSIFWAKDISLTFRRVVILWALWLGALGIAKRYTLEDILNLAFLGSGLTLVIGISTEIFWGAFHPLTAGYRFAGLLHPNHQGWTCSLLLISSVVLAGNRTHGRFRYWLTGLLALIFLILTKSRIATISAILALLLYWYIILPRPKKTVVTLFTAALFCLLFIIFQDHLVDYGTKALSMGRTDSSDIGELSGRIPLWRELLLYVQARAFAGYGFNGFWTPQHVLAISERLYWGVPGAHSGIFELLLGVGIVGAVFYGLILLFGIKKLITKYQELNDRGYLFALVLVLYFVMVMLAEEIFSNSCFIGFIVTIILLKVGLTSSVAQPRAVTYQTELSGGLQPV